MLATLRSHKKGQLAAGLLIGVGFGFLLQRGGVTHYDVVVGQLLLQDFTVVKIMLTAIVTGMVGVHALCAAGWATLSKKPGSVGSTVFGGLVFGAGFAVVGYCPGTMIGAVGQGSLDAIFAIVGMLAGAAAYAAAFPALSRSTLKIGDFGKVTLPELLRVKTWPVVVVVGGCLAALLFALERAGL
ncbi:MAG TPA: YeeE/YedE thiosulfate transporter family protein [Desulfobacterales bacterium]|nr:YeeE/YedE thiosulfate transporter family protein [Desulfobacterales bacterium]